MQRIAKLERYGEALECYDKAVAIYERLIAEGIYTPTAYNRLIVLYSKSKRNNDLIRILQTGINFFETRKSSQAEYLRSLAKKYNAVEFFNQRLEGGGKLLIIVVFSNCIILLALLINGKSD